MQVLQNTSYVYPIHSGKHPKDYVRHDDKIREDICILLTNDPYVDPSHFTVDVKEGVVILSGSVEVELMRVRAEQIASMVFGVKSVKNHLDVKGCEPEHAAKHEAASLTDSKQQKK